MQGTVALLKPIYKLSVAKVIKHKLVLTVNQRSSKAILFYISSCTGHFIACKQASHAPEIKPTATSDPPPPSSFIVGPYQPAHPVTNYQTNEPTHWRQMRKNSL